MQTLQTRLVPSCHDGPSSQIFWHWPHSDFRAAFFLFHYFRDNLGGLPHIEVVQKSKPVKHYEICLQAKSDMYSWNWLPRYVVDMETVHELLQETTG